MIKSRTDNGAILLALALAALMAILSTSAVAEPPDAPREAIVAQALIEYREADSIAAVEFVCAQRDPMLAIEAFRDLMHHCYREQKDLAAALVFARAGVQHGLTAAAALPEADAKAALELRSIVKGITYDIASFTWPGWDEKGIEISKDQMAEGLQAARANLRMAKELEKEAAAMARAYWILGAQELSAGSMDASRKAFVASADEAKKADARAEDLMDECYTSLVAVLEAKDKAAPTKRLRKQLTALRQEKDGAFYADQVETALQVFGGKKF